MNESAGDRVTVNVTSQYGSSWGAEIDLELGTIVRLPERGPAHSIAHSTLANLRAEAKAAYAQGDHAYTEQFADGIIQFTITLNHESINLSYECWGGCDCDRVSQIYAYVRSFPKG